MTKRKLLPPFPSEYPELLDEWDYKLNGEVDPYSISIGSTKRVWWRCKKNSKHSWEAIVSNRTRKSRGCPYCAGLKVHPDESLAALFPNLIKEWHPTRNDNIDPYTITPKSVLRVWWKCTKNPEHEWNTFVRSRTETDTGCPYCAKENLEKNLSVAALYPEIADEWNYEKNKKSPKDYTAKSGENVWWICKDCLYEWRTQIKNRTLLKSQCPMCARDNQAISYKKNRILNEQNGDDYSFEVEEKLFLQYKEIQEIFKYLLKIELWDKTIDALLSPRILNKIDYNPYYQRKYVWDNAKATYFIESILIGTEIPPLILFETDNKMEVIDGRQRFETIMRFYQNEFALMKNGLNLLKFLERKNFDDLENELKELFIDTRIRIIKFSLVDERRLDEKNLDMLKKEIFRRYNSGITPLKRVEIEKAIYINDEPTKFFRNHLKKNKNLFTNIATLFSAETDLLKLDKNVTLEKLLQEIRFLLICTKMPISSTRQKELFEVYYNRFSEDNHDTVFIFKNFIQKIKYLLQIKKYFESHELKVSRYAFETLYWILSIFENEKQDINKILSENFLEGLIIFFKSNYDTFIDDSSSFLYSQFMKRYNIIANYFANKFDISFNIYISSNPEFRIKLKEYKEASIGYNFDSFEKLRIDKPEPIPYTIDDICRMMLRGKFLVRPVYQRGEVINKIKSSAIIESILLGIKLPPMFIFQRNDGIYEVIDGQQRILSILGFMDQEFLDEKGKRVKSEKNGYKLTKLKILDNLNGLTFSELDEGLKDSLYDFPLSFIMIDSKLNSNFEPVDLFIRLNNRPYPIKENSFEMWNSYLDKELIDSIKILVRKYDKWFYHRQRENDKRMKNEELYTIFTYLEYKNEFTEFNEKDFYPFLDVHHKSTGLYIRIKSKIDVTKVLNTATIDSNEKRKIEKSIRSTESFLKKLKLILIDKEVQNEEEYLAKELTRVFNVKNKKWYSRTLQDFYTLWYLIHFINYERILSYRTKIKRDLIALFEFIKNVEGREDNPNKIEEFKGIRHKVKLS